ncbi:MAG TPA: S53 family peptidase [Ktedonobacterales bacterium]
MRASWPLAASLLVVLVVVPALAGCASGSGSSGTQSAASVPPSARHASAAHTSPSPTLAPVRLGPADPAQPLTVELVLRGQDDAALAATLAAMNDPRSPTYHHYLSPREYAARFGPSDAAVASAEHALTAAGFTLTGRPAPNLLAARGFVTQIEALFGVQLESYRDSTGRIFAQAASAPHLPPALAAVATGVLGLDGRPMLHTGARSAPRMLLQPGSFTGYTPSDLRRLYDVSPVLGAGANGAGVTIALAEIDAFRQSDVDTFDRQYDLSAPPVRVVTVGGQRPNYGPESIMDIEVIQALAPQAQVIAYEGGDSLADTAAIFAGIVSDHRAQIVSISLGVCELGVGSQDSAFFSSIESTFQQADAEGMSVLVASGDSGAYGCQDDHLSVQAPSSSPYVTAVGGTALFANGDGSYDREVGWEAPFEGAGGGGGLSVEFARPSWQSGSGVDNQYSNGMRQVPDVSADSDVLTGYSIYDSASGHCQGGSCWQIYAGTSAAAPLWAALVALADRERAAQHKPALGFLNPALYQLGSRSSSAGPSPYHDVTAGGNLYYPATPGWDYSTGWGTPDAATLVADLVAL